MGRLIKTLVVKATRGELDPKLAARRDIDHYYDGMERMRNALPIAQGGWRRRDGSLLAADVSVTASATDPDAGHRWVPFKFSVDDQYMLLFLDQEFRVFKRTAGVWSQVHAETGLPWTGAQVVEMDTAQRLETLIVTHRGVAQHQITRTDDTTWTVAPITFDYIPKEQFVPSPSTPDATITPDGETGIVKLTLVNATFGGWTASHLDQHVILNGGEARITQINSATVAVAAVILPFYNLDTIASGSWTLDEGWEDAWSVTRGYPAAVGLYQGRVYYGGGLLADTVWGSRVGVLTDFEPIIGLDDEPVTFQCGQSEVNSITRITAADELTMFTTGGVFTVPQAKGVPIKPTNAEAVRRVKRGAAPNVQVPEVDGAILFVQKGGKTIRELITVEFDGDVAQYAAEPLSLLSGHLLASPVDLSLREATSTEESDLLISTQGDGTVVTSTLMRSQNVNGWASHNTDGLYLGSGVIDEAVFSLVKRTIDGTPKWFAEVWSEPQLTDCGLRITAGLPAATFVAAHLPNTTVSVTADGSYMGMFTTDGSGSFTLPRDAEAYVDVGLAFPSFTDTRTGEVLPTPYIRTMPFDAPLPDGTVLGRKSRVVEVTMELFETAGLRVNGNRVSFRQFGVAGGGSPLDAPPPQFTGQKKVEGMLRFTDRGQVAIDQTEPVGMTVLGFSMKVSV